MNTLLTKLDEIAEKAEYLLRRTEALSAENRALREKLAQAQAAAEEREERLRDLQARYEMLRLARDVQDTPAGGNEKSEELKKRIHEYIREIDQCLKLIGD